MKNLDYYLDLNYEIKLRKLSPEEGDGWLAEIPLLPGCISDGETPDEAIKNVNDAKKSWIETCLELGRSVPEPVTDDYSGQLRLRMPKSLHQTLAERAKEEKISLNQYINYQLARSLGHSHKSKIK